MRKVFLKSSFLLLILPTLMSSCASIVSSSANPVYVHTNPPGVNVSITNKKGIEVFKGQSPATVTLKTSSGFFAKAEYKVKLSSPGFNEKIVSINYKINGWYFGNLLIGGVLGMLIVDPATGAMWKIVDPVVDENLVESALTTSNKTEPTLNIIDIKSISKETKSQLIRLN